MYTLLMLAAFAAHPEPMVRPKLERQLIVVSESQLTAANDAAVKVFGPRAANAFSAICETEAKAKVYVASWPMTKAQKVAWEKLMESQVTAKTVTVISTKKPNDELGKLKITKTEAVEVKE